MEGLALGAELKWTWAKAYTGLDLDAQNIDL